MEIVVNEPGGSGIDARHFFEVRKRCPRDGFSGAEILQERPFARRTDAADLVERALRELTFAPCTMRADRKTMRLVAQPLGKVKRRISWRQVEGLSLLDEEGLAAGVAIAAFGD